MEIYSTSPSFGATHSALKTLWKKRKLPTVTRGFYGDYLTRTNLSLEHLALASRSGRSDLSNLVLASKRKNFARGSRPLWEVINLQAAKEYLSQFRGISIQGKFNGESYIKMITRRLKNMGIDLEKGTIKRPKQKYFREKSPKYRHFQSERFISF